MKILKINGIKGLVTALLMGVCLFHGFVIFPGSLAMQLWNKYLVNLLMFPSLNLFQGVLLWGMVVTSYCILTKSGLAVSFKESDFSDEELESIIKSAKINSQLRKMNNPFPKPERSELLNSVNTEKETPFISSAISVNKQDSTENVEEEKVSNIK